MSKITLKLLMCKKGISMTFIILCSLFISGKAFSAKHWNRENISVAYDAPKDIISIKILFIDYEFGTFGEHAYLENLEIVFCTVPTYFRSVFKCQVQDQILSTTSMIYMTNRDQFSRLWFSGCFYPRDGTSWDKNTNVAVYVKNITKKAYITILWKVFSGGEIDSILVLGKWHVNGLFCSEEIVDGVYKIPYFSYK